CACWRNRNACPRLFSLAGSVQNRKFVRLANQLRVDVEKEVQTRVRFQRINLASQPQIRGVVVAFGLDESGVELCQLPVAPVQGPRKPLKLFAASALDERAANEMIDRLVARAVANRAHQAADPRAGMRLIERNSSLLQQVEYELEVLQFLDGNGVEYSNARMEIPVFLQIQGAGGGLSLEVCVVHQHGRQLRQHFLHPRVRDICAPQEHLFTDCSRAMRGFCRLRDGWASTPAPASSAHGPERTGAVAGRPGWPARGVRGARSCWSRAVF